MVQYMDKKVGQLVNKINAMGIADNTVIMFLADNGTPNNIVSMFRGEEIDGGKGTTTQYGTHVPFIVYSPGNIPAASVNNNLVDLTDFMPTFSDITHVSIPAYYGILDGVSFYSSLKNPLLQGRDWTFCHWLPPTVTPRLHRWAQTTNYKLYDSTDGNRFFDIVTDPWEEFPINKKDMTDEQKNARDELQSVINQMHN